MPRGIPNSRLKPEVVDIFGNLPAAPVDDEGTEPDVEEDTETPEDLTPDQLRIRELEDLLARERGRKDPERQFERPKAGKGTVLIHVLHNGFTANGQVWFRGQELEFDRQSKSYKDTLDRHGKTWLDLRDDDFAQVERYGEVMFRSGPWPGKSYLDAAKAEFEPLKSLNGEGSVGRPTVEELARAEHLEQQRARGVPRFAMR
jgi:hypothetical protein